MLSKEEIEEGKAHLWWMLDNGIFTSEDEPHIEAVLEYIEQLEQEKADRTYAENYEKSYISKLESDKQKLIEKIEERIKAVDKCYNELLTDVGGIKIINVTGLTKKEKEEVINKRNCLLVQKHCYVEILSILKGEKYANKSKWR